MTMRKSTSQKVKVGIFMVLGTLILIVALYSIGKRQHIFSKNIQLHSVFGNINGLQVGNNVRYSGVNVGTVSKIEMTGEGKINVQMAIEERTALFIKKNAITSISSDGLVGSMVVNIIPGQNEFSEQVSNGDTLQSYSRIGAEDMLSTLNTTNENAALLTSDLLKITNKILEGKGTLGALVSDTLLARDIKQSLAELKNTSRGASEAVSKVNAIIGKINYDESAASVLLSDTVSANQLRGVFENIEKFGEDLAATIDNLNQYINEIRAGEGAVNYLTQDDDFVKEIDSTMKNIKEAAEKLNENMEAMRSNFLFRGYFKRMERREAKGN